MSGTRRPFPFTGNRDDPLSAPPDKVLNWMIHCVAYEAAKFILRDLHEADEYHEYHMHPGDSFGDVLCWLWTERDYFRAADMTADLLSLIRVWTDPVPDPRPTLEQLLSGIRYCIHSERWGLSESGREEIIAFLRAGVPPFYGDSYDEP